MSSDLGVTPTAPVKPVSRKYLRLSVRAVAITVGGIVSIIGCSAFPEFFACGAALSYVLISILLLATLMYGRGWIHPFAIGFAIPHVLGYMITLSGPHSAPQFLVMFIMFNALSVAAGLVLSIIRSFFSRRGGKIPVPEIRFLRNWLTND